MRYNSYTLFFSRSNNSCYGLEWNGFISAFKPDHTTFSIQHEHGMYISNPSFDLPPASATVYWIRVAVREDSPFFNYANIWSEPLWGNLPDSGPLETIFGEVIQRVYSKEIKNIIANAVEI